LLSENKGPSVENSLEKDQEKYWETERAKINTSYIFSWIWMVIGPFSWNTALLLWVPLASAIGVSLTAYIITFMVSRVASGHASLMWPMILFVSIRVVLILSYRVYDYCVSINMMPQWRKSIASAGIAVLLHKKYAYFQQNPAGNLVTKINDLMRNIPNLVEAVTQEFLGNTAILIVAVATLMSVHPIFGLLMMLWAGLVITISWFSSKICLKLSHGLSEKSAVLTAGIMDVFNNILSVRLFSNTQQEDQSLLGAMDGIVDQEKAMKWAYLKLRSLTSILSVFILAANGWFLCQGYGNGTVNAGEFGLVLMINRSVMEFLWKFDQVFSNISEYYGSISQAIRGIVSGESMALEEKKIELQISKGDIVFSNVTFAYPGCPVLFKDLSVHISGGEKIGIVGYSGGGKTSFVHALLRLYDIQSGHITIDGQDIADISMNSFYDQITLVPQEISLFERSIAQNIYFANTAVSDAELHEALENAKAQDFVDQLVHGKDTLIGKNGVRLSGGQKQRIGLARAMVRKTPIVILDESTSQLDSVTEAKIQEKLWDFFDQKTVLVIAHRLSTLHRMDRILVFDQGRIVEQGTHAQLVEMHGIYEKLLHHQE